MNAVRPMHPPFGRSLIIDLFAGAGGTSEGIRKAFGRCPDFAVNHDDHAIRMHEENHPDTRHFREDVFSVDPLLACDGRRPDLLTASPDCTHFSRAKGKKPKSKQIRGLAWVVVKWARTVQPRVIVVENVPEFVTWGPLHPPSHPRAGHPDKARQGETFHEWVGALRAAGYVVEWRAIAACDLGAPTTRKRLYVVARSDGQAIEWPELRYGKGREHPHKIAGDLIDWTQPMLSIFATSAEAKAFQKAHKLDGPPKRPLADATLARIAEGMRRYVFGKRRPFLVNLTHGGRLEDLDQPFRTVTGANRGEKAVASPIVVAIDNRSAGKGAVWGGDRPLTTVTAEARHALAAASLIQVGWGENKGQAPRVLDLEAPLGTVCATGNKHGAVAYFLAKHNWGKIGAVGQSLEEPAHTITGKASKALIGATLVEFWGTNKGGRPLDAPLGTVTAGGGGHAALVSAELEELGGLDEAQIAGGRRVAAFLMKYYKEGGQWAGLDEPMPMATGKARFALITVEIDGSTYVVIDIAMRMLTPRELARAQGFPDSYQLTGTKTQQIERIGNSVCPDAMAAIVSTLLPEFTIALAA